MRTWSKLRHRKIQRDARFWRAVMEPLDQRLLLSVVNESGDTEYVVNGSADTLSIYDNGSFVSSQSLSGVTAINITDSPGSSIGVTAPSGVATSFSVTNSTVILGSLTINFDSSVSALSLVGSLNGIPANNALVITDSASPEQIGLDSNGDISWAGPAIQYSDFQLLTVNAAANTTFNISGDNTTTTLSAPSGTNTFTVTNSTQSLTLEGGSGEDSFEIDNNSGVLAADGGSGVESFDVVLNNGPMTLNGGSGSNSFTIQSDNAGLTVNGGGLSNTYLVQGNNNSSTVFNASPSGADSFTISAVSAPTQFNAGAGVDSFDVTQPLSQAITITGNNTGGTTSLSVTGSSAAETIGISPTQVTGIGAAINFTNLASLNVNGGGGADVFDLASDTMPVTLSGGSQASTFNIGNGTLALITQSITIHGGGTSTLNVIDTANTLAATGTLTATTVSGLDLPGTTISYDGLLALNLKLGSGGNSLDVPSTSSTTSVTVAGGTNTFVVGNTLSNIAGTLTIAGSGSDTLNVSDASDSTGLSGRLSGSQITGLGSAGIHYSGMSVLNLALGSGGGTLAIASTSAATTISAVNGPDVFNVGNVLGSLTGALSLTCAGFATLNLNDSGDAAAATGTITATQVSGFGSAGITYNGLAALNLALGTGGDTVQVLSLGAYTSLTATGGTNTYNIGTNAAPAGAGNFSISGAGGDTLNVDDLLNLSDLGGSIAGAQISGFGQATINYVGVSVLNVTLGAGEIAVSIPSTSAVTSIFASSAPKTYAVGGPTLATIAGALTINGSGTDILSAYDYGDTLTATGMVSGTQIAGFGSAGITYSGMSGVSLELGVGVNAAQIVSTSVPTTITSFGGTSTFNVGNTLSAIAGALNIVGAGGDTLNVSDTADATAQTGTLTSTQITGLGMVSGGITYSGLAALSISLGSGGNNFDIASTSSAATILNSGAGNDTVAIFSDGGLTTVNVGTGTDTVSVVGLNTTTDFAGLLTLNGNGSTAMTVQNSSDFAAGSDQLSSSAITGSGFPGIDYSGAALLTIDLPSATANPFIVASTSSATTTINEGADAVITVEATTGATIINDSGDDILFAADNGLVTGIQGAVTLHGDDTDSLVVLDGSSQTNDTGTLTTTQLTGLGMGVGGITFNDDLSEIGITLGSGNDTFTLESTEAGNVAINLGDGDNTVNVLEAAEFPGPTLDINTGGGTDTINFGTDAYSGVGLYTLGAGVDVSGDGNTVVNLNDSGYAYSRLVNVSSSEVTFDDAGVEYDDLAALNITLSPAGNSVSITSTSSADTTVTSTGTDVLTVTDSAQLAGPVTINGSADTLTVMAVNTSALSGTLTATQINGLGSAGIDYTVADLNVGIARGVSTFVVLSTNAATTTTVSGGNDYPTGGTYVISTGGPTFLEDMENVIVGDTPAGGPSLLSGIQGPLTITSGGLSIVDFDDGAAGSQTGLLTFTSLTGLGMGPAGINFGTGIGEYQIELGSGTQNFTASTAVGVVLDLTSNGSGNINIQNTGGGSVQLNGSSGTTVEVGSAAPSDAGNLRGIRGLALSSAGTGNTLVLGDTGETLSETGTLTATQIAGLGIGYGVANPGSITYDSGFSTVMLSLGSGGNTLDIADTSSSATTTIKTGLGNDTVNLIHDSGPTNIKTQGGTDTVNIQSIGAATTVNAGSGSVNVKVGSLAPLSGGTLNGIQAPLTIVGRGTGTLTLDDFGVTAAQQPTLTATQVNGLGLVDPITYSGMSNLSLLLGTGKDTLNVSSLDPTTIVSVDGSLNSANTFTVNTAGTLAGALQLSGFPNGSVNVGGNYFANISVSGQAKISKVHIGGSIEEGASIYAYKIGSLTVTDDMSGTVYVVRGINILYVGQDIEPDGYISALSYGKFYFRHLYGKLVRREK
jgi:hypothetical protein